MQLRLRNYESKETQRIQVPSPCSFLQLQETITDYQSSPLYFSLNAKDILVAPSPQASLQSLGVTGGDLIHFSINPNAFSSDYSDQVPQSGTLIQDPNQTESKDVVSSALNERLSEPYFLRKVLGEELGDNGSIHQRMAIAVHAVLLESGFVGFDTVSGLRTDGFRVPDEYPSRFSHSYSLPELLRDRSNLTDYVVIKFLTLGRFFRVYGTLFKGSELHSLSIDESRFAKTLDLVCANCANNDDKDGSFNSKTEKGVFELWKIVKDGLALPLLIDLCYKTGLALPACLIRLPAELKLKIIESLPGPDIETMRRVSSEMRYLASKIDLLKHKSEEDTSGAVPVALTRTQRPRFILFQEEPDPFHLFGPPYMICDDDDASPFGAPLLVPYPDIRFE